VDEAEARVANGVLRSRPRRWTGVPARGESRSRPDPQRPVTAPAGQRAAATTSCVPRSATAEEIKKAYRQLARKHHPDLQPAAERARAAERLKGERIEWDALGGFSDFFGSIFGRPSSRPRAGLGTSPWPPPSGSARSFGSAPTSA
jgi:hypothetical protein